MLEGAAKDIDNKTILRQNEYQNWGKSLALIVKNNIWYKNALFFITTNINCTSDVKSFYFSFKKPTDILYPLLFEIEIFNENQWKPYLHPRVNKRKPV